MEMTELVVEVGQEVLVLLRERRECSLAQDAAPFQVVCTSTFAPSHRKQHDYLEQNHSAFNSFIRGNYIK